MLLSRIFQKFGQSLVVVGALTLLFVAYQLWGTGFLTDRYQEDLKEDFEELVEIVEETNTDLSGAEETPDEEITFSDFLWRSEGEAIAQLVIPRMDLTQTVVSGVSSESLRRGPGHYQNTPMPGMPGNASIAGHRTTWGAPFSRIDELEPGDEINIQTIQGSFTYKVVEQAGGRGSFIVSPQRLDVLGQNYEEYPNRLTLISCHPKLTARNRIIVVAELVGEPAEYFQRPDTASQPGFFFAFDPEVFGSEAANVGSGNTVQDVTTAPTIIEETDATSVDENSQIEVETPTPTVAPLVDSSEDQIRPSGATNLTARSTGFGEGLDGDRSAILPSITWGVALLVLMMSANYVASRWKKWPTYLITFIPFVVVMSVWFFNLDRALPSY
ncbi:MAG TPA: class E sortase [Acidimicrobiales bacterium]|nr:class E sortase [Acidimicrobiales bacterium]|tara:strand:- start:8276 stop:9430 length:1155 start_codon:yes stop_codon:yes gene_type:complete